MKIAFDQQVFLLQEIGGISRYVCNLASNLTRTPGVQTKVFAPLHFNQILDKTDNIAGKGIHLRNINSKLFRAICSTSECIARYQISAFRPKILHETFFSFNSYAPHSAKRVVTVYDMITEKYPEYFGDSHLSSGPKRASVMRADHVVCISENTRRDLIEIFGVPADKTSVTYLASEPTVFYSDVDSCNSDPPSSPFLLFVGGRGGYKNFGGLLKAFASSDFLKKNFSIFCFGGNALTTTEITQAVALGISPNQLMQISGDDCLLASYYRRASALVYPSLYEGFGLPLLEAMACNCPIVCSNTSSLPEVGGNAVEYFDPMNLDEMIRAIECVLQSSSRREDLISYGNAQCAQFSWEKCARETLSIYRSLI